MLTQGGRERLAMGNRVTMEVIHGALVTRCNGNNSSDTRSIRGASVTKPDNKKRRIAAWRKKKWYEAYHSQEGQTKWLDELYGSMRMSI